MMVGDVVQAMLFLEVLNAMSEVDLRILHQARQQYVEWCRRGGYPYGLDVIELARVYGFKPAAER